jgi:streptogramin lyase
MVTKGGDMKREADPGSVFLDHRYALREQAVRLRASRWRVGRVARVAGLLGALMLTCLLALPPATVFAAAPPPPLVEYPVPPLFRGWMSEIALGSEGQMWYLQSGEHLDWFGEVDRISANGVVTGASFLPERSAPIDVVQGPDGNMWVTEPKEQSEGQGHVARFAPAGQPAEFTVPEGEAPFDGLLHGPLGIAAGPDGRIWFTDNRPDEAGHVFIGRIKTDGAELKQLPVAGGTSATTAAAPAPTGIVAGADGALWFTDRGRNINGQNLIGRITTGGSVTEFPVPTPSAEPTAIAQGADGNMWFTEPGADKVGRITPSGAVTEFPVPIVGKALRALVRGPDGNMWFTGGPDTGVIGWISPAGVVRSIRPTFIAGGGSATSLAIGPEGDIWFTDPRFAELGVEYSSYIGHLAVPFAPANSVAPVLSGPPSAGQVLSTSAGSWTREPTEITYQWQRCDAAGAGCEGLSGEVAATHLAGDADVGHTLRTVVSATNVAGSASAVSNVSPVVQLAAKQGQSIKGPPVVGHLPVVGAAMTWRFAWTHGHLAVKSLVVRGLPADASVESSCTGPGCRVARAAAKHFHPNPCHAGRCALRQSGAKGPELNVLTLFRSMRLRAGAQIRVSILEPGAVGRTYLFVVHKGRSPSPRIGCLSPGSFTVGYTC